MERVNAFAPVTTIENESRADSAYRQLLAYIEEGDLPDGSRLPSETELVSTLNLSRASIRDALARLRAEGRAVSRKGSGTYAVRDASPQLMRLSAIGSTQDLVDWHEFRLALESEAAALAAERRTDSDLAALEKAQSRLVAKLATENAGTEDATFHSVLAACSHSPKLSDALGRLTAHIFRWSKVARDRGILTLGERREVITLEHGGIIAAVVDRDADRARAEIRRHLLNGRARVLGALGGEH
ncbi:MAG: FCD domain-containing protein [Actinomycetota bacterium]